ncbi:MAG: FAD-dependent oxidoreductase, partial [Nitratireductor sp.]
MATDVDASVDVLVIGAGGCGLVAALAAERLGASVAIVEKAPTCQGNTALSSGSIPAAGTRLQQAAGVEDTAETFVRDLMAAAGQHDAAHLVASLASTSADLIDFLIDEADLELELVTGYKHVGHSTHRLHAPPSRRGADLIAGLERAVAQRGIPLAF